jgi:hypothetical protein
MPCFFIIKNGQTVSPQRFTRNPQSFRTIPDEEAEKIGGLRVVDEDGEDYLYDAEMFCPLQVPPIVAQTLISIGK